MKLIGMCELGSRRIRCVNNEFEQFLPIRTSNLFLHVPSKNKSERPDDYLTRNMPEKTKKLHEEYRKNLRNEKRQKWWKENGPKK